MPSLFTRIIACEVPCHFVFQAERWVAFLDIAPANPGHTLLVPRIEEQHLCGLPADTLAELGPMLVRLTATVKEAIGCPAVNVLINDGPEAGQVVPHLHIHVIPRWANDGNQVGWKNSKYEKDDAATIAGKLRAAWDGSA